MPVLVDLTGKRFGSWLVLSRSNESKPLRTLWTCICDCGVISAVYGQNLRNGSSTSCGCSKRLDLTGKRFGKLLLQEPTGEIVSGSAQWKCTCECGKVTTYTVQQLVNRVSCGCIKPRHGRSNTKQYRTEREAARRASLVQRTPTWSDLEDVENVYSNCPEGYHVDHIIPLFGKYVSGLHIAENLQYLSPTENFRKSNKFIPYIENTSTGEVETVPANHWN